MLHVHHQHGLRGPLVHKDWLFPTFAFQFSKILNKKKHKHKIMSQREHRYICGINLMSLQFLQTGHPTNNAAVGLVTDYVTKNHYSKLDYKYSVAKHF